MSDQQDLEVLLDPETLTWRSVRPWNPKSCSTQVEQILDHLKKVGSATIPEIASVLNLNPNYVTNALWRLQTDNSVQKEPGKKYHPAIYHYTEKSLATIETEKFDATIKSVENGLHTNSSMVCNLVWNQDIDTTMVLDHSTSLHTIDATLADKKAQKVSLDPKLILEPFPNKENGMLSDLEAENDIQQGLQLHTKLHTNSDLQCDFRNKSTSFSIEVSELPETFVSNSDTSTSDSDASNLEPSLAITSINCNKKTTDLTPKHRVKLKIGDQCRYVGATGAMAVSCRGKILEVLEVRSEPAEQARVRAAAWSVDYWVSFDCLRRV